MTNSSNPNNSTSDPEKQQAKPDPKPNKIPPVTRNKGLVRSFDNSEFNDLSPNTDDIIEGNKD